MVLVFLESLHRYSSNFSWVNSTFSRSSVAVLNSKAWSFTNFQNFSSLVLASFFQSVSSISSGGGNGLQIKVCSEGGRGKLNLQVVPPFLQLFEWFLQFAHSDSCEFAHPQPSPLMTLHLDEHKRQIHLYTLPHFHHFHWYFCPVGGHSSPRKEHGCEANLKMKEHYQNYNIWHTYILTICQCSFLWH